MSSAPRKRTRRSAAKPERAIQQRTLDTRRKILDAAIDEFAKHGYEGATTRAIAESAGLMHTLVTYHFSGKEGLWREAIATAMREYAEKFEARMHGLRGVDDTTKLRLIYEDFIHFSAANLNFHRMMSHVAASPSRQLDWLVDEYLRESFDQRAALIRAAQKAGRFVEGDPYHLDYVFIGAVTRIFMLSTEVKKVWGRSPHEPSFVDDHVRVCLSLFFRDPPQRRPATRASRK